MIHFSDLDLNPDRRRLRQFAGAFAVFLSVPAWRSFSHWHLTAAWTFVLLAVAIGIAGIFVPQLLRPFYIGGMLVTYPIGWVVSHAALCLLYYGLMTPIGLLLRLLGRDRLRLKRPPAGCGSYWIRRTATGKPERYLRQF